MSQDRSDRRGGDRRSPERRATDRRVDPARLPVPIEGSASEPSGGSAPKTTRSDVKAAVQPVAGPDAVFTAQLMAGAPKRGLKGGPETLDQARSTYLGAEYSGANDRRPKKGRITKTEI